MNLSPPLIYKCAPSTEPLKCSSMTQFDETLKSECHLIKHLMTIVHHHIPEQIYNILERDIRQPQPKQSDRVIRI